MNAIKELREAKGLTQIELAEIIGVSQVSIARYETNTRKPEPRILSALADFFKVTTDYIANKKRYMNKRDLKKKLLTVKNKLDMLSDDATYRSELSGAYVRETIVKIDIAIGHIDDVR